MDEVNRIVALTKWPTWVTCYSKSLVDERLPNVHGIYQGDFAPLSAQNFFKAAGLVLFFGPNFSSANTFTSRVFRILTSP
jgi:pyruvate decarboxylase